MTTPTYMFASWEELTQSELFLGHVAYPTEKLRNWYTWLYLAEVKTNQRIKIGITNSLARRSRELERREPRAVLKFAWSMPCPALVERAVKQMLGAFIVKRKDAIDDEPGYTEILQGLPMIPLLLSVRLIILYVYLNSNFIPPENNSTKLGIIRRYMGDASSTGGGSLNANVIKYSDVYYEGTVDNIEWRATYQVLNGHLNGKLSKRSTLKAMQKMVNGMGNEREETQNSIRNLITALETEVVRNRHVCVIEDVYNELNLTIEGPPQHRTTSRVMTAAQQENQSFFKFYVTSLTADATSLAESTSQLQERPIQDRVIDESMFNDDKPSPSRINDVKNNKSAGNGGYGSKLYLACDVEIGNNKFVRFFPIVVTMVTKVKRGNSNKPRSIWYKWASADWKPHGLVLKKSFNLDQELERSDFRDRPSGYPKAWGVYKNGDKTPESGAALGSFDLSYTTLEA